MKKKVLALFCAMCVCILSFSALFDVAVLAEERIGDEYLVAEADLSTMKLNYTRMSVTSMKTGRMADADTQDDRTGVTSNIAAGRYYLPFKVDSSFLPEVTEYTPVEITVDYYDCYYSDYYKQDPGYFAISYDKLGAADGVYDTLYVELENTGTWKSHTFYIDNCRFGGKVLGADFIIKVNDELDKKLAYPRKESTRDVLFGSVTVRKVKYDSLVKHDYITSAKEGNIFGVSDSITFTQDIENKTADNVVSKYSWDILDEEGQSVASYSATDTLTANETKTRNVSIDNPGKYGIYRIYVTEENYPAVAPGNTYAEHYSEEFSVCISLDSSNIDENFGFNQAVVRANYLGEPDVAGPLMLKAGARWNRESLMWSAVESKSDMDLSAGDNRGVLNISETSLNRLRTLTDMGINVIAIPTGRHPLHGGDANPNSDDDIAAYARFCAYAAETLGSCGVTHFEIWNEWNSVNFNPTNETPETYAKLLKAAYRAIKDVNPDAVVIGCDVAGISDRGIAWIGQVLDALDGGTYMDAISVHCYDYEDDTAFPEAQVITEVNSLKTLLETKGYGDLPIWLTETGFSTYENSYEFFVPGCKRDVQLNSMVMSGAINKAYGLFDKFVQYCLYDNNNRSIISDNWGVLNCWSREKNVAENGVGRKMLPNGAKPSYLGVAAMNYFTGGNTTFMNVAQEGRSYAFEFDNSNLGKKVILAINGGFNNDIKKEFHLGCTSISLYDKYGNLKDTMNSATGDYLIDTHSEPTYIVGNFTNFDVIDPYIRVSASVDLGTNVVTIEGNTCDPQDLVSVMVVTDGAELASYNAGRVKYLGQTVSDDNGDFSIQYTADSLSGKYQIYVNSEKRRSKIVNDLVFSYVIPEISVTKNTESVTDMLQLMAGNRLEIKLTGLETAAEHSPKMIVAQYAADELISFNSVDAVGSFTTLGDEFITNFTVAEGAKKIKIMYWNMDNCTPLIACYEIN
ncbi:MAG: hypothetical protein IK057_00890 [Clostridia bacterium]|nr:hypothetical protein [Clostridia bacterium]